eukprot:Blabericola_migrator_1__7465@NODE_380_length_9199_cov_2603_500000_g298_i1_p5_GENE_NODE_380_length_9199_cov_2603_500000_g298_i1NODE_380_length_9199_cov_2603_500000_g298_i1_p5_ORF_typecomplete_len140_score7_92Methyltransf_24/PF13578_6/3_6e02Methyltransf_24/PF13578_6/1_2_NODE_380_length_9199_cov_2603_500000_g298_i1347766
MSIEVDSSCSCGLSSSALASTSRSSVSSSEVVYDVDKEYMVERGCAFATGLIKKAADSHSIAMMPCEVGTHHGTGTVQMCSCSQSRSKRREKKKRFSCIRTFKPNAAARHQIPRQTATKCEESEDRIIFEYQRVLERRI